MPEKHVVRALILNEKEEILLDKRAGGSYVGKWEVPGGMVDAGEDPKDAVVREVGEEVGLIFDAKTLFKKDIRILPNSSDIWHVWYFSGEAKGKLIIDQKEVDQAEYVSQNDLDKYDFAHNHLKDIIDEFYLAQKKTP